MDIVGMYLIAFGCVIHSKIKSFNQHNLATIENTLK